MRIAVFETAAHGGLLHYAVQLADGLAGRGHEVDVLATRGNELERHAGPARMRPLMPRLVRRIEAPASPAAYRLRQAEIAVRLSAAWARGVWAVRRGGYDAVVFNADITLLPATVGLLAATAGRRRAVLADVCHNVRVFNRYGGERLFGSVWTSPALLRRAFARVDVVLVHGERSRGEFREHWGDGRVAVIPHGDERLFGAPPPPSPEERLLFFGDWRKVKGLPVLLDAFDRLVARRPGVRLTIAGTPAPADLDPGPIRAWAAGHGDRVELVDHYVPVEDVPALFGRARAVVTPYVAGYQSGVAHLAMTMARAVVSSDVGDLPSAVRDGETGRVVPAGDAEALAAALEEVVADPALATRLGREGRRRLLETSSWERVAELVEAALLGARPGQPPSPK